MKLNHDKTKLLCISAAKSYSPTAFIKVSNDESIISTSEMKVLGFYFNNEPNVKFNMNKVQSKFKSRLWSLRHLKKNGFEKDELVKVYQTMIRPIAEYCSSVFHTLITQSDSLELERIQMQALKVIFGCKWSYSELLEKSGLEKLHVRREAAFVRLAVKMSESARYSSLFPRRLYRAGVTVRNPEKYKVYKASTGRYLNSPLNMMRRKLNDLEGIQ